MNENEPVVVKLRVRKLNNEYIKCVGRSTGNIYRFSLVEKPITKSHENALIQLLKQHSKCGYIFVVTFENDKDYWTLITLNEEIDIWD